MLLSTYENIFNDFNHCNSDFQSFVQCSSMQQDDRFVGIGQYL